MFTGVRINAADPKLIYSSVCIKWYATIVRVYDTPYQSYVSDSKGEKE